MPTPNRRYCFTPSQLDAFQDLLDSEILWNDFWGNSEEPPYSPEEFAAQCEKKLIDQINRCPKEPIEVADRGTCFNAIIDWLNGAEMPPDIGWYVDKPRIVASLNSFRFQFSYDLCQDIADRFKGAISQYRCEAKLPTAYGEVTLYGYLDEWQGCKISDLKTTGSYKFGKYERKWQRHVYPYCIVESGDSTEIKEFEYTAVELSRPTEKNPIINGKIYPEIYTYDHNLSRQRLVGICEQLILWLESRRELISDRRIFGEENPEGYVGVPIEIAQLLPPREVEFEEIS